MTRAGIFEALSEPVSRRVTSGLTRIGLAVRSRSWRGAEAEGVTPTQAQALAVLHDASGGMRLAALAAQLGVSAPTMSARVDALIAKGLVEKTTGPDRRSIGLRLTPQGEAVIDRAAERPDPLADAVAALGPEEQAGLLRSLVTLIRTLQVQGDIAPQRMCVTCRHFRPFAHPDPQLPHHCAYVDAPFGDRHLRLSCAEQEDAPDAQQQAAWRRFTHRDAAAPP